MKHTAFFRNFLLTAVLLTGSASAVFAEYFVIRQYDVQARLDEQGALLMTETIEVEFVSERHGIFRFIPLVNTVQGEKKEYAITGIETPGWPFTTSYDDNHNLVIKIGDPDKYVNGRQQYVIRYKVLNPVNFFDDHAELYWDLLGISWPVVTESFRFEVDLPDDIPLSDSDIRTFSGAAGNTGSDVTHSLRQQGNRQYIQGQTNRVYTPGEAVTIAVRLPRNRFPEPNAWELWQARHGQLMWPFGLVAFASLLAFFSRNKRITIVVEHFPPLDVSPAIAGGFIDHTVDNNDVLSLIPYLAEKGYLSMSSPGGDDNIVFSQLKAPDDSLRDFEKKFLEGLFESGPQVHLSTLKNKFYIHMNTVRSLVERTIRGKKWYEGDQMFNAIVVFVLAIGCGGMGCFKIMNESRDGWVWVVCGVVLLVMGRFFNKRNQAGNLMYQKLEGFRRFVKKAETPVLEKLIQEDPLYFDKTLPYAVAFGESKRWTAHFQGLVATPPSWYNNGGQMRRYRSSDSDWGDFQEHFSTEMNNIGTVFGSQPSSKGGSSGSSGGSSGGGGGGGGGGSW